MDDVLVLYYDLLYNKTKWTMEARISKESHLQRYEQYQAMSEISIIKEAA